MLEKFVNSLDYSQPITSYDLPQFSQLQIPWDNYNHTLLATVNIHFNRLILQDVLNIKKTLIRGLEITDYAIQLAAIHDKSCCIYWFISNQIRPLLEDNLNQPELWDKGIILVKLLPINFYSNENALQNNGSDPFNLLNLISQESMEV